MLDGFSPLEPDALTLLFPSPLLRVRLYDVLPEGMLEEVADRIMDSWADHQEEQDMISPDAPGRRATDQDAFPVRARSPQQLNEEFFYFQKRRYGVTGHFSDPSPEGWMASPAAQELLSAVNAAAARYLESVGHWSGRDIGSWAINPDRWHMWASVHQGGSTHASHMSMGAAVSAVLYIRTPPGTGQICFLDPRGRVPPFERQVRHSPVEGDLLLFPPWLPHSVACGDDSDGPRISISFNLFDEELEGGRYAWGESTAGIDAVTIEDGMGLAGPEPWRGPR